MFLVALLRGKQFGKVMLIACCIVAAPAVYAADWYSLNVADAGGSTEWARRGPDGTPIPVAKLPAGEIYYANIRGPWAGYGESTIYAVVFGRLLSFYKVREEVLTTFLSQRTDLWVDMCMDSNKNAYVVYTEGDDITKSLIFLFREFGSTNVVRSVLDGPWDASIYAECAVGISSNGLPVVAYMETQSNLLHWAEQNPSHEWTNTVIPVTGTPTTPLRMKIDSSGIPVLIFKNGADGSLQLLWRNEDQWHQEQVSGVETVATCCSISMDSLSRVAVVYSTRTNGLMCAFRSSFGTWIREVVDSSVGDASVTLSFSQENFASVAYQKNGDDLYYAQRDGSGSWINTLADEHYCPMGDCFYVWQWRGIQPCLVFDCNNRPVILHKEIRGNYKVDLHSLSLRVSSLSYPDHDVWWDWAYHDDADGIDDRTTESVPTLGIPFLAATQFLDNESIDIRFLADAGFAGQQDEAWVHWWDGATDQWIQAFQEEDIFLPTGSFHGCPTSGTKRVVLWKASVPPTQTQAGTNYYVIQLKSKSIHPWDEDWLTREATGGMECGTNNMGQTLSDTNDYAGHDWSVTILPYDEDLDGLPTTWEEKYFGGATNADPSADTDADGRSNLQEYWSDTNPNDPNSFFGQIMSVDNLAGAGGEVVLDLGVGPATTNSRVYDAYWSTGLQENGWSARGLNVPGDPAGAAVLLKVTNTVDSNMYYRAGVKLP